MPKSFLNQDYCTPSTACSPLTYRAANVLLNHSTLRAFFTEGANFVYALDALPLDASKDPCGNKATRWVARPGAHIMIHRSDSKANRGADRAIEGLFLRPSKTSSGFVCLRLDSLQTVVSYHIYVFDNPNLLLRRVLASDLHRGHGGVLKGPAKLFQDQLRSLFASPVGQAGGHFRR